MDGSDHRLDLPAVHMTLHGLSIAGIYTSLQIPEAKLCFDCGIVTPQSLRMPYMALTHGHMDHAGAIASGNENFFGSGQPQYLLQRS